MAFERGQIPGLTGFLTWLETDDVEVKRQMDSEGHRIRVMTVHGAKGLEAPIVILPETVDRAPQDRDDVVKLNGHLPVWKTPKDGSPPEITRARLVRQVKNEEESLRLLYVALTRARAWLIVCGAGEAKKPTAWYRLVEQGMQAVGTETVQGGVLRHGFGIWPEPCPNVSLAAASETVLPEWVHQNANTPVRDLSLIHI